MPPVLSGPNVLSVVTGQGNNCVGLNLPCTGIGICNVSKCQTVNGILVDTGSYGMRIFSDALSISLPPVSNSSTIGECSYFGSMTAWGPVVSAKLSMGGEPSVTVPIQIIEPTFEGQYDSSGNPVASSPPCGSSPVASTSSSSGYSGLMGVGLFEYDCGSSCVGSTASGIYFSCGSNICSGVTAPLSIQVSNPVASLPVDNNGVVLSFPSVPSGGDASIVGTLTFGIGTESNNVPGSPSVFDTNTSAEVSVLFQGTSFPYSFIDSGSNAFYFQSSIPTCSSPNTYFYCPSAPESLTETMTGSNGTTLSSGIDVGNFNSVIANGNSVYSNIGGSGSGGSFDLGLPFFFGKSVYVGINGFSSSLGTGPLWAY